MQPLRQVCRSGCAFDEGTEEPGDDDDLDTSIRRDRDEAGANRLDCSRSCDGGQEQEGAEDDPQQPDRGEQALTTEALIVTQSICHAKFATSAAATRPIGMAYFAGQRNPMSRIPARRMGASARSAATARLSIVNPIRGIVAAWSRSPPISDRLISRRCGADSANEVPGFIVPGGLLYRQGNPASHLEEAFDEMCITSYSFRCVNNKFHDVKVSQAKPRCQRSAMH